MNASWFRLSALAAVGAFALVLGLPDRALAVDSVNPVLDPPRAQPAPTARPGQKSSKKKKKATKKDDKRSERQFIDGYRAAHALIYRRHDYTAAIGKLHSLRHDDNPDVANLIGYASRKLGRYDDSKVWYERALAADPKHTRTWSYYGMWHAEQGNLLKARDFLARVEQLCGGTRCREYTELKGVIEGTRVY
ncbi:MAG: tetratricopeptide repeat protein [Xanthobacteraceae bacterium]